MSTVHDAFPDKNLYFTEYMAVEKMDKPTLMIGKHVSGTVIGAALGALVLATIDNGLVLLGIPEFWRMFIQGSSIVAAAAVDVFIGARIRSSLQGQRFGRRAA